MRIGITAIDRVPEFWRWLEYQGLNGAIKIPVEVLEEIKIGSDALAVWAKQDETEAALLLEEESEPEMIARVIAQGYAADLTDSEIELLGRDPFLIAHALAQPTDRCVVTTERSRPSRLRANRHVPDVCNGFGMRCVDTFG